MSARLFHVGLWLPPEDLDRALLFFRDLLGFKEISRAPRKTGGERLFLQASDRAQYIEILVSEAVKPQPPMGLHPKEKIAGIPHICFVVDDLPSMRTKLLKHGFEILTEVPSGLTGYVKSETGEHRILFVKGPGHCSIEIFEFKQSAFDLR